jgi:hypothetical protein
MVRDENYLGLAERDLLKAVCDARRRGKWLRLCPPDRAVLVQELHAGKLQQAH